MPEKKIPENKSETFGVHIARAKSRNWNLLKTILTTWILTENDLNYVDS